jgi:hypothetical protein
MSVVRLADTPAQSDDLDHLQLVEHLSGENQALQSVIYGLCMGLSQMSDVHREVVAQAFEYAHGAPRSNHGNLGEGGMAVREQSFRETLAGLKEAVTSRFRRS